MIEDEWRSYKFSRASQKHCPKYYKFLLYFFISVLYLYLFIVVVEIKCFVYCLHKETVRVGVQRVFIKISIFRLDLR